LIRLAYPGWVVRSVANDTRGIVDPVAGFERFTLSRHEAARDLQWAVDRYWVVSWDLRDQAPYEQQIVRHPAVHLVFERDNAEIESISPHDFVRRLEGRGRVFGVKFRPAGFRPFLGAPISGIVGQRLQAATVFGTEIDELAGIVSQADDVNRQIELVDLFLRSVRTQPLAMTETINTIVAHIASDRSIRRVDDLAGRLETSTRRLQRLFAEHVGMGPKWVINRCRFHEAAEVAVQSAAIDWAALALELGYSDQSHLVRDFTTTIGRSPDRYLRSASNGHTEQR
jgi:AraC-like DNA-binding protein